MKIAALTGPGPASVMNHGARIGAVFYKVVGDCICETVYMNGVSKKGDLGRMVTFSWQWT